MGHHSPRACMLGHSGMTQGGAIGVCQVREEQVMCG